MAKVRYIKKDIRMLRKKLEGLVEQKGTRDSEVLRHSTNLDGLLNEYYLVKYTLGLAEGRQRTGRSL